MTDSNKNKIFSEKDFDKPSSKGNWFSGHLKQLVLGVLVVLGVVLAAIFVPRGCSDGNKPVVDTLVTDSVKTDSVPAVIKDSVKPDSITETPVVEETKEEVNTPKEPEVKKVNEEKPKDNVIVSGDVKKEALSVIRGKYGNNPERRRLLKERYQEIQNKVNEMYRNGQVK